MQKLALMMAVMILGMSPAHGHSIGVSPGSQGVEDQAEMTLPLSTWSGGNGKQWWANLDQAPEDLDRTIFRDLSPTPKP
jgi:hypothetical protein